MRTIDHIGFDTMNLHTCIVVMTAELKAAAKCQSGSVRVRTLPHLSPPPSSLIMLIQRKRRLHQTGRAGGNYTFCFV